MSFSGRRVSILRPAETRRFSATKDLSQNGMFFECSPIGVLNSFPSYPVGAVKLRSWQTVPSIIVTHLLCFFFSVAVVPSSRMR